MSVIRRLSGELFYDVFRPECSSRPKPGVRNIERGFPHGKPRLLFERTLQLSQKREPMPLTRSEYLSTSVLDDDWERMPVLKRFS